MKPDLVLGEEAVARRAEVRRRKAEERRLKRQGTLAMMEVQPEEDLALVRATVAADGTARWSVVQILDYADTPAPRGNRRARLVRRGGAQTELGVTVIPLSEGGGSIVGVTLPPGELEFEFVEIEADGRSFGVDRLE